MDHPPTPTSIEMPAAATHFDGCETDCGTPGNGNGGNAPLLPTPTYKTDIFTEFMSYAPTSGSR